MANLHRPSLALIFCALAFAPQPTSGQEQPNIVVVFMDNFGWGEPGFKASTSRIRARRAIAPVDVLNSSTARDHSSSNSSFDMSHS